MNNRELLIKISLIHALKCAKSTSFGVAIKSFNTLDALKGKVLNLTTEYDFRKIIIEVSDWQGGVPSVSEQEIINILNNYDGK